MPLRVVQSPGCKRLYSDSELGLRDDDILIDTGLIAESLGYVPTDPNRNAALLRVAARMRGVAITAALEDGLDGVVRTSNPRSGQRLLAATGATKVEVIALTRSEACKRIRRLYPNDRDRAALCEIGLDRYFDNVE